MTFASLAIVTPLYAGGTLQDLFSLYGAIPLPDVRRFTMQILQALAVSDDADLSLCCVFPDCHPGSSISASEVTFIGTSSPKTYFWTGKGKTAYWPTWVHVSKKTI